MAKLHLNRGDNLVLIVLSQQMYALECFWCELDLQHRQWPSHLGWLTHRDYIIVGDDW
jgi:hypothetical protein